MSFDFNQYNLLMINQFIFIIKIGSSMCRDKYFEIRIDRNQIAVLRKRPTIYLLLFSLYILAW